MVTAIALLRSSMATLPGTCSIAASRPGFASAVRMPRFCATWLSTVTPLPPGTRRYRSTEARVGLALARWPDGSVPALTALVREQPRSALVRLNLGFAQPTYGRSSSLIL